MITDDKPMDISVTDFKARCLDLIRRVETSGKPVSIWRRGRVVARLVGASSPEKGLRPSERLRALGASCTRPPTNRP